MWRTQRSISTRRRRAVRRATVREVRGPGEGVLAAQVRFPRAGVVAVPGGGAHLRQGLRGRGGTLGAEHGDAADE